MLAQEMPHLHDRLRAAPATPNASGNQRHLRLVPISGAAENDENNDARSQRS